MTSTELNINEVPIYVVTLNSKNERCDRLRNRLLHFDLLKKTTFVNGYPHNSALVQWYCYHMPKESKVYSCTINHFLCLRKFVESKKEYGMILEDDAMFHFDFVNKVNEYLQDPPDTVLMLGFTHGKDYHKQVNPGIGLNKITFWTCGGVGYIISRNYAIQCLHMWDQSRINYYEPQNHTSECITTYSKGNYINPPLIIEEAVSSVIGHNVDMHLDWFSEYCNLGEYLIESESEIVKGRISKYIK